MPPRSDFLGSLDAADREALFALGTRRNFAKGEFVFRVGDPGAHVYFLESGRIKICQPADSRREVILWFCLGGEIFGLAEVARGGGRVVSAIACEKRQVLAVSKDAFKGVGASRPRVALLSMRVLSARLGGLSAVPDNLVFDDADRRFGKPILRLRPASGR